MRQLFPRSLRNITLCFSSRHLSSSLGNSRRYYTVLGLESSADDSCAAIVTSSREIKANIVIRQDAEHQQYGGIHPYVAVQSHQKNVPIAVKRALAEAQCSVHDIDGIAFTRGPGMPGCLTVAATTAKALAAALGKPLVGVHHMHAHALTPFLSQPEDDLPAYPFLTLLLTGGHTLLLLATSPNSYEILAESIDSTIGFAYDRTARALAMPPHPKGPGASLEAFCAQPVDDSELQDLMQPLGVPLHNRMAFSYAGIVAQVVLRVKELGDSLNDQTKLALARAFQNAAARHLEEKLLMAIMSCRKRNLDIKHMVISGGVASNMFLRNRLRSCLEAASLASQSPIKLICPPPALCTDNAAMIAWASMTRFLTQDYDDLTVSLRPTWTLTNLTQPETEDKPWKGRRARHPEIDTA